MSQAGGGTSRLVLVLSKPMRSGCALPKPTSCSSLHVTAVNFRSKAPALPLLCVFGLRDALSSQTSSFFKTPSLSLLYNTCALRCAYVRGRGREATQHSVLADIVSQMALNQPAGHVRVISITHLTGHYLEILRDQAVS